MIRTKALATLQFTKGGLFDGQPRDHRIHLVRMTDTGTPGKTLCGIERFGPGNGGWSVGGGITGPGVERSACAACVDHADLFYRGAPVWSSSHGDLFPMRAKSPWSVKNLPVVATEEL
ncbi:hypothetical protein PBI_ANDREW_61 [Arthrobacter phage Andrew]|uniref:Uncharacterized protein n=1 Tax=Arthrobacter phage Andrew TaxID=2419946 RepID=A0A3G2KDA3_9CAUD|nr:hypothetical protein HOU53_gp61 [Arthrobacter phage Andrew]AYN56875.1 hypothetical protein PBI_ANDREW_61 [Arthrobacter phage Andrew]